jgi:glycolate oxidase
LSGIQFPKPDPTILARRDAIIDGLAALVAPESLITTEDERRAFETDALTAYRRMPLAVVLPRSTEELSAVRKMPSSSASPKWRASSTSITPIVPSACRRA